ncbi:MAG: hypothetical protein V4726_18640 [Verrucomicrobiota bacterium]
MARFIQSASAKDLAGASDRNSDERAYESSAISGLAFLRWLEMDQEAALRHNPAMLGWSVWARLQPKEALAEALKSRPDMLDSIIDGIAQSDPALARKLLEEHPGVNRMFLSASLREELEKTDPAAAASQASQKNDGALTGIFTRWFDQEPEKALAWMRGLTDPVQRRVAEEVAFKKLTASDPATALKEARQLPAGGRQLNFMADAIVALAHTDPAAGLAAAESVASPFGRQKVLVALAGSLTASDPGQAAALVSKIDWRRLAETPKPEEGEDAILLRNSQTGREDPEGLPDKVITGLMASVPEATANALATLPPESGGEILGTAIGNWAGQAPEAASAWIRDQPAGPVRDRSIEALTHWLIYRSPEPDYAAALSWAEAASPEKQRWLLKDTVRRWRKSDPLAAAEAVEGLKIPEEQRDALLEMIEQ